MSSLKKAFAVLAGCFLVALLLAALAPRAAHAVVAALVQVTNTAANPVPTMDVAPTQIFQNSCIANTAPLSSEATCAFSWPAGKRLVVQSVSVATVTATGARVVSAQFVAVAAGNTVQFPVVVPYVASQSGVDYSTVSQDLRFYADEDLLCFVSFSTTQSAGITCNVAGYLIDSPSGP